jgi:hypothetical protein
MKGDPIARSRALPEPATFVLVGINAGLAALAFRRRGRAF